MTRPDRRPTTARRLAGFATTVVMGLVAVIGLLSVSALHDALFAEQLAASRMLHQRAAALANLGVLDGMGRIGTSASLPTEVSYAIQSLPSSGDSTSVKLRHLDSRELPAGFSATRFAAHYFEIESTGHTARGVRLTQVQGATRVMPVGEPATSESDVESGMRAQSQL